MRKNLFVGGVSVLVVVLFIGVAVWIKSERFFLGDVSLVSSVVAEDDDDENRDEEDEDDDDDDEKESSTTSSKTETITAVRYEVRPVTQQVVVTPSEYLIDTDGDGLVDGIDPDPKIHQREYFTDSDDDGIANVFDKYLWEDDFAYYEDDGDENMNGIIDSYETVENK